MQGDIENETCSYFGLENHVLPRNAGSKMGVVRVLWLCLENRCKSLK